MTVVAVGSDHAGYNLKTLVAKELAEMGVEVLDLGTDSTDSVDYPDFGEAVGRAVADGRADLGVAVCGSGIGIGMAAGKIRGVRAAVVHDVTSARMARAHNNANVMTLGERFVGAQTALDAVRAFLETDFDGGRHQARVAKLDALDGEDGGPP